MTNENFAFNTYGEFTQFMSVPEFANREQYVAWRTLWRAKYKLLSQNIRDMKRDVARRQREETGTDYGMSALWWQRHFASKMMELRMEMKTLAISQRDAALNAKKAA